MWNHIHCIRDICLFLKVWNTCLIYNLTYLWRRKSYSNTSSGKYSYKYSYEWSYAELCIYAEDLSADALPPSTDSKANGAHGANKYSQLGEAGCAALLESMLEGTDFSNVKAHIAAKLTNQTYPKTN